MKKRFILLLALGCLLLGCTQEEGKKSSNVENEADAKLITSSEENSLEGIEAEEIELLTKAVNQAEKMPGIVNVSNPEYTFSIGEESYFLWLTNDSGMIMNTKDTHTVYTLPSNSVEELYKHFKKG